MSLKPLLNAVIDIFTLNYISIIDQHCCSVSFGINMRRRQDRAYSLIAHSVLSAGLLVILFCIKFAIYIKP
jgi:uncharacterized membrane protein